MKEVFLLGIKSIQNFYKKNKPFFFLHIFFFLCISLNSPDAFAASATLSWEEPTTNEDGTPLVDLAGYKVYYGTASRNYSRSINVGDTTTYTVANLTEGYVYYFAVTAYDSVGSESNYSNEAIKDTTQRNILTVNKSGLGAGTVTSSPRGINCGSDCSEAYNAGTIVTLTASTTTSSTFGGWSGSCTGTGTCTVMMNASKTVTAKFDTDESAIPTGSITINNDEPYTKSQRVRLNLSASGPSGVNQMCISNEVTCTSWIKYARRKSWTLPAGDGQKTVHARFKDKKGNISTSSSDSIILDTTTPSGSLSSKPGNNSISLNWSSFSDPAPASGIEGYVLIYSTSRVPPFCKKSKLSPTTSFVHTGLDARRTYHYRLCAIDNAENTGVATTSVKPTDTTPPTGSITINRDKPTTSSQLVRLYLSATDPSGVTQMCISNEVTCTSWVRYRRWEYWMLPAGDGQKTVYVKFKDGVGNISTAYSDSVILDNTEYSLNVPR